MVRKKQNNQFPYKIPDKDYQSCSFASKRKLIAAAAASFGLFAVLMVIIWPISESKIAAAQEIFEFSQDSVLAQAVTNILTFDPLKSLIVQVRAQDQIVKCETPGGVEIDCSQADEKTVVMCTSMKGISETCIRNGDDGNGQVDQCATPGGGSDKDCQKADEKSICTNKAGETINCKNDGSGDDSANQDERKNSLGDINQTCLDITYTEGLVPVDCSDEDYDTITVVCTNQYTGELVDCTQTLSSNEKGFRVSCTWEDIDEDSESNDTVIEDITDNAQIIYICTSNYYFYDAFCTQKQLYHGNVNHFDIHNTLVTCEQATEETTVECLTESQQVVDCPQDWSTFTDPTLPSLCGYLCAGDNLDCELAVDSYIQIDCYDQNNDYDIGLVCRDIDTNQYIDCVGNVPILPYQYGSVEITCTGFDSIIEDNQPFIDQNFYKQLKHWCGNCCEYIPYCEEKQDSLLLQDFQINHFSATGEATSCEASDVAAVQCINYQQGILVDCPDFSQPYVTHATRCMNRDKVQLDCNDYSALNFHTVLYTCISTDSTDVNVIQIPCNTVDEEVIEICAHIDSMYKINPTYEPSINGAYMPVCPWDEDFDSEWSACSLCGVDESTLDKYSFQPINVDQCSCADSFTQVNSKAIIDFYVDGYYGKFQNYDFSLANNCDDKTNYGGTIDYVLHCVYSRSDFKEPWVTDIQFIVYEIIHYQDLPEAECENERLCYAASKWDEYRDPCLQYYEFNICSRCKFGAVRIFTENGIFCGYVDEQTTYENQNSSNSLRCYVDKYYDTYFDPEINLTFEMNNRYRNHTSNTEETICLQNDNYVGFEDNCLENDYFIDDETWANQANTDWNSISVGCRECNNDENYYSRAYFYPQLGIYGTLCQKYDLQAEEDKVENNLCGNGKILQWVGLIPSELELECKGCEDLIPNCLSCDQATNCVMCKSGFSRSEIVDSFGNKNSVCVYNFCGFYGEGSGCNGQVLLEGCERSDSLKVRVNEKNTIIESCIRCAPGYHKVANEKQQLQQQALYRCQPNVDKITLNFFVAPFDSIGSEGEVANFDYFTFPEKGKSITDPIYSIQQALSNFQEGSKGAIDITQYREAVVTLYLFKGVHHFISCQDFDQIDSSVIADYLEQYAFLCYNYLEQVNCVTTTEFDYATYSNIEITRCDYVYPEQFRENMSTLISAPQASDNLSLHIVSMDCKYIDTYLFGLTDRDLAAFEKYCIDVENGEKAQIRIANEYTYFNITNFAEFRDIEFTGEDLFASATYDGQEMDYMGKHGILAFMPFTKCTIQQDAEKLSTIDDISIKKMNHLSIDNFEYECIDGFQKSQNEPPNEKDDRCFPNEYSPEPNSESCSGEPYHKDFFTFSQSNNYFTKRHKVLFNLYSFDSLRKTNTSPPELKITNCRFKFFVDKTDALIQVETNNLGYLGLQSEGSDERFLSYYGEDRGAIITIDDSEFHSNSFCKGLIYYNQFQTIPYSEQPDFLNFTANAVGRTEVEYNDASENYIRIKDSEFKNMGFHQVIQAVNRDDNNKMNAEQEFINVLFNRFQDQGLILNANGYSGSIEVSGSSFSKNIAYIQEILMTESLTSDLFYDFSDQEIAAQYSNDAGTSLQFKFCTDVKWTANYFFQNVINPDTEFDDAIAVDMIENVSAFIIKGNRGPMIFVNNTFFENIGMTGGVIHIESPDFRFGDNPYIVIKQNRFINNMAYWAGNVFHIQMNVRMFSGLQGDSDAWQTCGAGILIEDNFFTNNVGLKKHNGGVGVIRCQHFNSDLDRFGNEEDKFTYRSGKKRTLNSDVDETWLDDPSTHKSVVTDILNPSIKYEILTYGTLIKDNTFENNYSGKKGTALLIELVNELQIEGNSFKGNGPVHAYSEIAASPYYKHFLYNKRTLSFYLIGQEIGNCIDEAAWFNRCYRPNYKIDMPQVQGAVYIKNCYDQGSCWFIGEDLAVTLNSTYEYVLKTVKPWQSAQIKDNIFFDNHANIVMFDSQEQPQASSLFIYGGTNTTISGNEFVGHRNWADFYIRNFAYDIDKFMPPNYFKYSQSAMIQIQYPYNVYSNFLTTLDNTESNQTAIETKISNNLISDNINIQVVTFKALEYKASILEFDCRVRYAVLSIDDNEVTRNQFIGRLTTLFFINGGIASVNNNDFTYNGILTKTVRSQSVANLKKEFSRSEFPWEDYSFTEAQEKGIFTIEFYYDEVPIYKAHSFSNNNFRHIYCQVGCAYHVTGTEIQQYSFTNNTYSFLISTKGAAVFYGKVDLQPSNQLTQVWTQSYRNETFDRIFGGSIQFSGQNVPVTFIQNSKFINNFGSNGAAINFQLGGGLYITESYFMLDYQNEAIKQTLASPDRIELTKLQDLMGQIVEEVIQEFFSSYDDRVKQSSIFDAELFDQTTLLNDNGQIYFSYTFNTVLNINQPVFGYDNKIMNDLIQDIWKLDLYSTQYSAIRDSLFKSNIGLFASAIVLDNSSLSLVGTNDNLNFEQNNAPQGPTISASFSSIISSRMLFDRNTGFQGGCYQIDSSTELNDYQSEYTRNEAQQGGVIFANFDSKFVLEQCHFEENQADEGAVLYASYNSQPQSLKFLSCQFKKNTAEQNLIQLLFSNAYIENSLFLDNSAIKVSHGITLITSKLDFFSSTVNFSEGFADTLPLNKLDTAFFSLFLRSSIQIGRNTTISNMVALNQAVLSAYSLSEVNIHSGVNFINNTALSSTGQTISLQNTGNVSISDTYFDNNQQINILVELGQISVKNSQFTNGRANHIQGVDSGVALDNVNIYNSFSEKSSGHGVYCNRCHYIQVENSNFTNLETDQEGGAIMLQILYNSTEYPISYIRNNTFSNNKANQGGAIVLDRLSLIEINNNIFSSNVAKITDGGAILYRCDLNIMQGQKGCTVSLTNNTFNNNEAKRKGGALRYENANFTDISLVPVNRRNLQQSSINNFFQDNKAAYGNDMASFPKSIAYIVSENGSGANIDSSQQQLEIAAGQDFQLDLLVLDQEGRIYSDENKAIAKIVFESGQDLGPKALMLGSEAVAKEGKFSFNSFKVRIKPSTQANITFQFLGLDHFGTPIEFLDNFPVFVVSARQCVQGEQYTEDLSCEPCPPAFYLYEAQNEPGQCKECNINSYCYGMNNTAPKPGYWRSGPTLDTFTPCIREESCLGGNETDPLGQCETGYKGILCNDCEKRYSRSGEACSLCPSLLWNAIIFGALIIGLILAIMFIVRQTLGGVETKKPLHQVLLKIFMNHFQVLAAISQIDFQWPEIIQTVISSQRGVADGPAKILSVDCLMMDIFPGGEPTMRLNYLRLIIFACLPIIIQIISYAFWQLYGRCARISSQDRGDKTTATSIIVLFLFYPTIVQILAKSINCVDVEGEFRLFDDLEEVCYEGTHLLILLTVSFPGLLAWAIGIPVYALIKLTSQKEKLQEIKKFSEGKQAEDLLRRFKIRLGFLTEGYIDKYYYWEIILLMRKTVIVLMVVFLSSVSSGVQSLLSILVLTIFFMIHWLLQPYYDIALNQMETLSLFVIISTIYFGLYYQAAAGDPIMKNQVVTWIIFGAVLIPSIVFAINFVKKMGVEILKVIAGKSVTAFKFITFGSVNFGEFKQKHMNEQSDDEVLSDHEKIVKPTSSLLVGFEARPDLYSKKIKEAVLERRKAKKANLMALEDEQQKEESDDQYFIWKPSGKERIQAKASREKSKKAAAEAGKAYEESVVSSTDSEQLQLSLINQLEMQMNVNNQIDEDEDEDQAEFRIQNNLSKTRSEILVPRQAMFKAGARTNIVQKDPGPFEQTQKLIKVQNFEYKEEIEFRNEQVYDSQNSKLIKEGSHKQYSAFEDDLTKTQSLKKLRYGGKKSGGKNVKFNDSDLSMQKNSIFMNTSSFSVNEFGAMLETDNDKLQSRNNQNQIKSGLLKPAGLTAAILQKQEDPSEIKRKEKGKNRQAQSQLKPVTLAKLKRSESARSVKVDKKSEMANDDGSSVFEDDEEVGSEGSPGRKDLTEPQFSNTNAASSTKFHNIFKKKQAEQALKPKPTAEQIKVAPRLLFYKKRNPQVSARLDKTTGAVESKPEKYSSRKKGAADDDEEYEANLDDDSDHGDSKVQKPQDDGMQQERGSVPPLQSLMGKGKSMLDRKKGEKSTYGSNGQGSVFYKNKEQEEGDKLGAQDQVSMITDRKRRKNMNRKKNKKAAADAAAAKNAEIDGSVSKIKMIMGGNEKDFDSDDSINFL